MSTIKGSLIQSGKKISIALIGLANAGKTTFVKRILQTQDYIKASLSNSTNLEFHTVDNLTLISWDLKEAIPSEDSLWKRSVMGADALIFVLDSTDKTNFSLNKKLLFELLDSYSPIRLLILASKSDHVTASSINELLTVFEVASIDQSKCSCDIFKFSSLSGEGLYAIGEWLNKTLFNQKERIINYVEIKAALIVDELSDNEYESLFVNNPNIILLTAFRELRRKTRIFSRTMRMNDSGQEIIDIGNYKVIFMKDFSFILAFLINFNDPINRAMEIAHKIVKLLPSYRYQQINIRKLITDLYPLDISE